jgi:hypothetical protein
MSNNVVKINLVKKFQATLSLIIDGGRRVNTAN